MTNKLVFFTSGHPFSLYVNSHWRRFPLIDISGGNVSHAAISLAQKLGAKKIYLAGTDFSYPDGKSYSRGTYLYTYFQQFTSMTSPLEHHFFSFLLRNNRISKKLVGNRFLYTTKPMISYKERLINTFSKSTSEFFPLKGNGVPLSIPYAASTSNDNIPKIFSAGSSSKSWRSFLMYYLDGLETLKLPKSTPISVYFSALEPYERDLWVTLLPAAAVFQKNITNNFETGRDILPRVKQWSIEIIRQFLDSDHP